MRAASSAGIVETEAVAQEVECLQCRHPGSVRLECSGRGDYGARMRDGDIRAVLRTQLITEVGPETVVIDELDLCGATRVDVALVNGFLAGFEIKSPRDSLRRLPLQVEIYSEVLDYAAVVSADNHLRGVQDAVPAWWGIWAVDVRGPVQVQEVRRGARNPMPDADSIVQLLWREEALAILQRLGKDAGVRSKRRWHIWDRVVQELSLEELQTEVRTALRTRTGWRDPRSLE